MIRIIAIALVLVFLAASAAQGQDKYYAVVFGYQDGRNRCCEAHSFAHFVQVRPQADGPAIVDEATISWLPASGRVKLLKRAEPGRNHTLKESLEAVKPGIALAQWGPFEIKEELFHRAKKQAQLLSSGGILYKAVEPLAREAGRAVNCEHAISDVIHNPGEPFIKTGTARGHQGSYLVAVHLKSLMIEPGVAHVWLNRSLGLNQYAIAMGSWDYQGPGQQTPPSLAVAGTEGERKAETGEMIGAAR
jgi:hypothetical protein